MSAKSGQNPRFTSSLCKHLGVEEWGSGGGERRWERGVRNDNPVIIGSTFIIAVIAESFVVFKPVFKWVTDSKVLFEHWTTSTILGTYAQKCNLNHIIIRVFASVLHKA